MKPRILLILVCGPLIRKSLPRIPRRQPGLTGAQPRCTFTAAIEVVATEFGARIKTRVRELSQQGCYVDTDRPLPLGTTTDVRITKGAKSFAARARVVYNQPSKGMGLMFTAVEPEQLGTLDTWIAESRARPRALVVALTDCAYRRQGRKRTFWRNKPAGYSGFPWVEGLWKAISTYSPWDYPLSVVCESNPFHNNQKKKDLRCG
jgi:hypothetical protein